MGSVSPLVKLEPRVRNANRRLCSCDACRVCSLCSALLALTESKGNPELGDFEIGKPKCALSLCPLKGVPTTEQVFKDFAESGVVSMRKATPAKKK